MKAYVLAAGYATRLGDLAAGRAKPLLEVAGRPVLSHTVRRLLGLEGLTELVIITNARFHEQFLEWAAEYGAGALGDGAQRRPIRIVDDGTTNDAERLGAAADLALGVSIVPPDAEDWIVLAGDNLIGFDLRPLQSTFRRERSPMLVLRKVDAAEGSARYNEVVLHERGRVIRFREKPADAGSGLSAIGLYFFTPEVVPLLTRYLSSGGDADAPGHFISWLVGEIHVRGAFLDGPWFDVGSPDGLAEARGRYGL